MANKILDFLFRHMPLQEIPFQKRMTLCEENFREMLAVFSAGHRPAIWFFGTPSYNNIGDSAIALSARTLLQDLFPGIRICEISQEDATCWMGELRNFLSGEDLIVLPGGGNMGDEYPDIEQFRRSVLLNFPRNPILSLPQTIFFSDTERGRAEWEKSICIYHAHPKFLLLVREQQSYEWLKQHSFHGKAALFPDPVLYGNELPGECSRNTALCCLRNDVESVLTEKEKKAVEQTLKDQTGLPVSMTDTVHSESWISAGGRADIVESKLMEFRKAGVVVTDRLHGMIFSAITQTPCLVFRNYNHKLESFYNTWLKDLPQIAFVNTVDELKDRIAGPMKTPPVPFHYDWKSLYSLIMTNLTDTLSKGWSA